MHKKIGSALVVGAGIGGIRAALDLAQSGYGVTLIDRAPSLTGVLAQLDHQFPTNDCGMCRMLPMVERDSAIQACLRKGLFHENIAIRPATELIALSGDAGDFSARLRSRTSWVDPQRCIGCGLCVDVCPVSVPDTFNAGLTDRKAIYLPVPHTAPAPHTIDLARCTRCGECQVICPTNAIRLAEQDREAFRILVVDDELIVRESLKEWLADEGFRADTAESGAKALEYLVETPCQLMLTDIKMPGMEGVELLAKARELHPDLVVVMMTAYATVETAVDAMKIGALDYLVKPFEPDKLIPMVTKIFDRFDAGRGETIDVGAVVLCGGTSFYDPTQGVDPFGYGVTPDVITNLEFERLISNSGPNAGQLLRPSDGRPIRHIAWIQCVGSRDLQAGADFCSSACCMMAIKEAVLARGQNRDVEATIYYMDLRTTGQHSQRYRDRAEKEHRVRFRRGRIHSVIPDAASGKLMLRYVDPGGNIHDHAEDLVVLSVGQRPATGMTALAQSLEIEVNPWGFPAAAPFAPTRSSREGLLLGGSVTGLKDIAETVIHSSSAALHASLVLHTAGGGLRPDPAPGVVHDNVDRQLPRVLVTICTAGIDLAGEMDDVSDRLARDPAVAGVHCIDETDTQSVMATIDALTRQQAPNRVLIAAWQPRDLSRGIRNLARQHGLPLAAIDVVAMAAELLVAPAKGGLSRGADSLHRSLAMGLARLKHLNPAPVPALPMRQRALVVGGGIAGLTAALAIADHGFPVALIEKEACLGGQLNWLKQTLDGQATAPLCEVAVERAGKHPHIQLFGGSRLVATHGRVGQFVTTVEDGENNVTQLEHGVTVIATGGHEAPTTAYGYGTRDDILTQQQLTVGLDDGQIGPARLQAVVMIQCVDSREEGRNYCSRVCCPTALKNALRMKQEQPDLAITILYRDMMSCGFSETWFTLARQAGILFISYDPANKPTVDATGEKIVVQTVDPILERKVEIRADLLILSTGIVPELPPQLAAGLGIEADEDGFFNEADAKWRPLEALRQPGVVACGLALSPRTIDETVASAEAAAQSCLQILSREQMLAGSTVAGQRPALCSLCEACIAACAYGARSVDEEQMAVSVNAAMCQGCGACTVTCPNGAAVLDGLDKKQLFAVIDAALA